ncbi:hypothetical protein ABPG74_002744 [Tetrahymena malaccensis]
MKANFLKYIVGFALSLLSIEAQNCQNLLSQLASPKTYQGYECVVDSNNSFFSSLITMYVDSYGHAYYQQQMTQGECNQQYLINPNNGQQSNDALIKFTGLQTLSYIQISFSFYFQTLPATASFKAYSLSGQYFTDSSTIENAINLFNPQSYCSTSYPNFKKTFQNYLVNINSQSSNVQLQTYLTAPTIKNQMGDIQILVYYQCPIGCSQCDNQGKCSSCISSYNFISNYCYITCNSNQFAYIDPNSSQQTCQQCDASCQSCFGDSKSCTACASNYYPVDTQASSPTFWCYQPCPNNYQLVQNKCSQCSSYNQKSCQNCGVTCKGCQSGNDAIIMANYTLGFNTVAKVLKFSGNSSPIDTFYLISVVQNIITQPSVQVKYNQIENACNDISFTIQSIQNDAKRGFLQIQWSLISPLNLNSADLQTINTIIQTANDQQSQSIVFKKQLFPSDTSITIQLSYILKVNQNGALPLTTYYSKDKQIVISSIQNFYSPIYRYMSLSVIFSFYVQVCDQQGITVTYETLDTQFVSQVLPSLNQSQKPFNGQQIEVDIDAYSIPSSTALDIQVQAVLHSNSSVASTYNLQITPQLPPLFIQIFGAQDQRLVDYKSNHTLITPSQTPEQHVLNPQENQVSQRQQLQTEGLLSQPKILNNKLKYQNGLNVIQNSIDKEENKNENQINDLEELRISNDSSEDKKQINENQAQSKLNNQTEKEVQPTQILTNIQQNTANIIYNFEVRDQQSKKSENNKSQAQNDQENIKDSFEDQKKINEESKSDDISIKLQKVLQKSIFWRILIFHNFSTIFFTCDQKLSRPLRFSIYYLRIIHSLSISTVFDEKYDETQMIIVAIINTTIITVSVLILETLYKFRKIGRVASSILMVGLLLLYYYIILAIISGESSSYSNSKIVNFFILFGVDFLVISTLISVLSSYILLLNARYPNNYFINKLFATLQIQNAIQNLFL